MERKQEAESHGALQIAAGKVTGQLLDLLEHFHDAIRPATCRFGIGFGPLNTRLQPVAIGMDGKAWHEAQDAINMARTQRKTVQIRGMGEDSDCTLSAVLNLLFHIRGGWNDNQLRALSLLESVSTQTQLAQHLGVSSAAISKRLTSMGWRHYEEGRVAFATLLAQAVDQRLQGAGEVL